MIDRCCDRTPRDDLERLFQSWRRLSALAPGPAEREEGRACETRGAAKIDPWVLMDSAKVAPAADLRDILFKLAFWRWSEPALTSRREEMSDVDAILYSAFRDLVDLTNERSVMTEYDKTQF